MQVDDLLAQSARRFPAKTAIVAGSRRTTYAGLDRDANRLAHALRHAGVRRHDRVAVFLDNVAEAAVAIFAILRADAVLTMIPAGTKSARLATILNDCRAAVLIADVLRSQRLVEIADQTPHLRAALLVDCPAVPDGLAAHCPIASAAAAMSEHPGAPPAGHSIDLDLAALLYTSGSTGGPKGVMLTHRNIVAAILSITTYLENTADDVIVSVLPLSFGYGLSQLLTAASVGATLVLERNFNYPVRILELMAAERATGIAIVPTMAAILTQMDLRDYPLPSLRYMTNAAAALPVPYVRGLRAAFPRVRLFSMYGLTECIRVAYLSPDEIDARPDSVGKPMPNVEVLIVDDAGNEVGPGEPGELVVRGSNVMVGYWERPDETARVLKPGKIPGDRLLFSGDIFRRDADGYLYFLGRRDDIIKTRGQKVSPREVEDVLLSIDGVAEAAVVGVPDATLTYAIKAVVTLQPGAQLTDADIRLQCAERLEDFMVPRLVEIRAELPRSANGKVVRRHLAEVGSAA